MNIKERLQTLKEQQTSKAAQNIPPKPPSDPGAGMKWKLTKLPDGAMTWEARPSAQEPGEVPAVVSAGKVTEQWSHYSSDDDSLFIAAQWDLIDENNQDWNAETVKRDVLAHITKKYGQKQANILDLDWESGVAIVQLAQMKHPKAGIEVAAELKDEHPVCPIDDKRIEIHACRGTTTGESCPFYQTASAKDYCTFRKYGAVTEEKTTLDQFIEKNKKREASLRIASAVLSALSLPKMERKASVAIPKDESYQPVSRRAKVLKAGHKGIVSKKNKDGSFIVKWDDGKEGAYWAHELTVTERGI
jgi:hypothetical protein